MAATPTALIPRAAETRHRSLHLLVPADESVLDRAVTGPELIDDVVLHCGRTVAAWAVETARRLVAELAVDPADAGDQRLPSGPAFVEALVAWLALYLGGVRTPPPALHAELAVVITDWGLRGLPIGVALQYVRRAHAALNRLLFESCGAALPVERRADTMGRISAELFDGIEILASAITRDYARESDRLLAGSAAYRRELLRAILTDRSVDAAKAGRCLGYDLSLHQLALVLWCDRHPGGCPDLADTAAGLLQRAGCSSTLIVPMGSAHLWAWGGRATGRPTATARLDPALPAGAHVHVAAGLPADGPDGFRLSHRQAVTAEQLGRAFEPDTNRLHDYGALELVLLLGADRDRAVEFVRRELGELAAADEAVAALRETVRCYLDFDRSVSAVARSLHIAKNTVLYRVRKAERLRGRPLGEDRLQLHAALHLIRSLRLT